MFLSAKRLVAMSATASVILAGTLILSTGAFAQQAGKPAAQAPAAPAQGGAQQQQPDQNTGPQSVSLQPVGQEWIKLCGAEPAPPPAPAGTQKKICYTTRDFGQDPADGPILAMAVYDTQGDDTKIVRFLTPVGLMLQRGIRVTVDKIAQLQQLEGKYTICIPNGCFAELQMKSAQFESLKKGNALTVSVKNAYDAQVDFTIPLQGFGAAFDGAPMDPKKLEEQQKAMQDAMEAQARQKQQELEQQQKQLQGNAPASGAPAPGVTLPQPK
ncbi:invasion associated locus B family protein [Methylovirgula sp. 4M-Z18]|uniref:invasion associated locus B family protein n=1 Tax=Methylovirgula sp. 4M-Z18 TaxID=2293567 RepID=UPI000E2FEB85|nr:invasion associated locus B family protein [Methylovirgula sp. 4M-Z18]RFB80943.1 invasion associated locus B family protein [Methylovirgula sp. 4M-Z18]